MYRLAEVDGVRVRINRTCVAFGSIETAVQLTAIGAGKAEDKRLANAMRAQADLLDPPYADAIDAALKSKDLQDAIRDALTREMCKAASK